jgi:hypothetical protein
MFENALLPLLTWHVICSRTRNQCFIPRKSDVSMINATSKLNDLSQRTVTSGRLCAPCSSFHKQPALAGNVRATPCYCNARYAFQCGMLASHFFLGLCSAALALAGCTAEVSSTPDRAVQELSSELRKAGNEPADPQAREGTDSEARRGFPCWGHACPAGSHCEAPADRPTCVSNANAVCTSDRQCPMGTLCCNPCGFHPSDPETEPGGFGGCPERCLEAVSGMCPAIP